MEDAWLGEINRAATVKVRIVAGYKEADNEEAGPSSKRLRV
jgi:hypothetical protein